MRVTKQFDRRSLLAGLGCGFAGLLCRSATVLGNEPAKLPKWAAIELVVRKHFADQKGFESNDMITRSLSEPVFKKLAAAGWTVPDQAKILPRLPADSDFVVQQLSSTAGKEFMRSISSYADGYDRLDKLSKLPDGKSSIRTLVKGPGGYKLLQLMTSETGRPQIADLLSHSPKGRTFDEPTGKLYTVDALLERLEQSYQAQLAAGAAVQ
jgi:hypothetical protein